MVPAGVARDVDREADGAVLGELVEQVRQVARDPGTHEDDVHPREHRAVRGRRRGELDLLQVVDADRILMTLLGQPDLDEVREHHELLDRPTGAQAHRRHGLVRRPGGTALGAEVAAQHPRDEALDGEGRQGTADGTVPVAVLQPARQHQVERGPGHDTELTPAGDRAGESPRGHGDTHAPLDDGRQHTERGAGSGGLGHGTLSSPTEA